jgi:hypothetical protein
VRILDWLRGKDDEGEEQRNVVEKPDDEEWPEEEELPGDEDDPTVYPLW